MPDATIQNENAASTEQAAEKPHAYAHLASTSAEEETTEEENSSTEPVTGETRKPAAKPIQPRINELVRKQREAERQADYWRGVAEGRIQKPANSSAETPAPAAQALKPMKDSFRSYDDYVEALAEWKSDIKVSKALETVNLKIEQRQSQQSAAQKQKDIAKNWSERAAITREVLPDFDEVLSHAEGAAIQPHTADLINDSPHGPAIAYKLAKDPVLLDKLNKLSPQAAAKEFGKMEAVFDGTSEPVAGTSPQTNASKAPKPPSGIQTRSATSKDPSKMSMSEYMDYRKKAGLR